MPKYDMIFVHARLYFYIHFLALFYGELPMALHAFLHFQSLKGVTSIDMGKGKRNHENL